MKPFSRHGLVTLCAALLLLGGPAAANPPPAHGGTPTTASARASLPVAVSAVNHGATVPSEGVVNVNAATEDELERLPGVGPARAHAIVQLRERVHQFGHAEDLLRVRGIGRVGFRRLRPFVTLTGPTTLAARPGRTHALSDRSPEPTPTDPASLPPGNHSP